MSELLAREEIERALTRHGADYVEVRLDDTKTNRIVYRVANWRRSAGLVASVECESAGQRRWGVRELQRCDGAPSARRGRGEPGEARRRRG